MVLQAPMWGKPPEENTGAEQHRGLFAPEEAAEFLRVPSRMALTPEDPTFIEPTCSAEGESSPAPATVRATALLPGAAPRWDQLTGEKRRAWSAEIAAKEALAQGLPLVASPEQHRQVAAILVEAKPHHRGTGSKTPGGPPPALAADVSVDCVGGSRRGSGFINPGSDGKGDTEA